MGWIQGKFAESFVGRLATSNDSRTTVLGVVAAALLAGAIDFGKLTAGDQTEIGKAVGVCVVALWGYWTNKTAKPNA